ncbi:hypothetical protein [Ramlibacter sp.]|uniref:hypothetical protein n=1 Tax=Ramlibacter sp. TaxID=1917967 RepID=UPI00181A9988|nr:hypothetical protein [Ramlibacter sp.]MBA2674262.1 hypothetical protein [Ramlibacter sp.]
MQKLMLKAVCHANGDLVVYGDAKALLFRALQDMQAHLESQDAQAGDGADLLRTVSVARDVLGAFDGTLPTARELLGDPRRELVARNLLKG